MPQKFENLSRSSSFEGNSIDAYIKNNYNEPGVSDSEYISDDSLKGFL
jgi:hypothetical protein